MASETSPLLESAQSNGECTELELPDFLSTVNALSRMDLVTPVLIEECVTSRNDEYLSRRTAFYLAVACALSSPSDIFRPCTEQDPTLQDLQPALSSTLLEDLFSAYVTRHRQASVDQSEGDGGLDEVLWTPLRVSAGSDVHITVVDLINLSMEPSVLFLDPIMSKYVVSAWEGGVRWPLQRPTSPARPTIIQRLNAISTPRASYALDTLLHVLHLFNFTAIILPDDSSSPTWQLILLAIYAVASMTPLRPSAIRISLLPILIAFLISIPAVPEQGKPEHTLLLLSYCWSMLLLLLPFPPTPIYLFPPRGPLAASLEFRSLLVPTIFRPVIFFLPLLLISQLLLSYSMDMNDPWFLELVPGVIRQRTPPNPGPTPTAFFILFILTFFFMALFAASSLIRHSFRRETEATASSRAGRRPSDLSPEILRELLITTAVYSHPKTYPPPLNLISFVFVSVPYYALYLVGRKAEVLTRLYALLRNLFVLPFEVIIAGLWGWNSRPLW